MVTVIDYRSNTRRVESRSASHRRWFRTSCAALPGPAGWPPPTARTAQQEVFEYVSINKGW